MPRGPQAYPRANLSPRNNAGRREDPGLPLNCCAYRQTRRPFVLLYFCGLIAGVCFFAGCAARHPVADRQPPPSPPTATPERTEEKAKNSTNVPPDSSAASTNAAPAARPAKRAKAPALPAPVGYTEEGNASWYGVPFHGRHAANGEIYDMYKLTAAHRTLPFESMVRVTNVNNGKSAVVRITDRGPFVENRIIDLSFAAAQEIESVGPGVVPIRLEVISAAGGSAPVDVTAGFFTVQVGAFRERGNAERLRERLSASYSPIYIQTYDSPEGTFYRVRVGKISGEDAARQYAAGLHTREGFTTFVMRLDESGDSPRSDR
jgi:peptidoglycan lytic transglycosylase